MELILGAGMRAIVSCQTCVELGHNPYAPELFFPTFIPGNDASMKNAARDNIMNLLFSADEVWITAEEITEDMAEVIRKAAKLKKPIKVISSGGEDLPIPDLDEAI